MEEYSRWDDFLVAEHELIERSMAVLKTNLERLHTINPTTLRHLHRALDFLLEFGDKIHNKKEEEFLFPLMQRYGIPVENGPLGVMLREHADERQLLAKMLFALPGLETAGAEVRQQFKEEGLAYLEIRTEHIWKENDVLYPMGRRFMTAEDNDTLLAAFRRINTEAYGEQAAAHFGEMVEEVERGGGHRRPINRLSYEQLDGIMEALPLEVTFVDAEDTVAYFNRLDKSKIFPRTRSVLGRKVEKCHPEKSVDKVLAIVDGFKKGTLDKAEFWIDFKGEKVLIRYFPVFNEEQVYLGVLEVTQAIGAIQKLAGQKFLLT